ncbi:MAG: TonB-dependent receptor [Rhodothermales bacterium]
MFYLRRYLVCMSLLGAAAAASAQVAIDTTIALPEATVTAVRDQASHAAVTRITGIPIGNAARERNKSLADLLDTSTGLYVRRYGPSGTASLSFRGTDPSQTEILLDGLRITDPQSGQVDLSLIPVVLLESVEIIHGAGSSGTAGGLGGTVRLRTLRTDARGRVRFRVGSGAYGERNVSALAAGGYGIVSGVAAVEHSRETGTFPYVNRALQPPEQTTRTGADMEATSLFGKVAVRGARHQAALSGWINSVDRGLPGPGNAPPVPSRQNDGHFRTWLNTHHRFHGFSVSSDWSVQTSKLHYVNSTSATDDRTQTTTFEGRVAADVPVAGSILLQPGADWIENTTGDTREHRTGVFGMATFESRALILEGSLRGETWFAPAATRRQLVPRAGLNLKDFPIRDVRLKASFGKSWTVPSLVDRYWVPGGNPNLRPERGWTGDAGLMIDKEGIELELTGFSATLTDRIVWIPSLVGTGVQVWRPTNVGAVHSYGFEGSAAGDVAIVPGTTVHGGVSLSYTEALDRSDPTAVSYGHQLKYVPRTVVSTSASLKTHRIELGLSGRVVGKRYVTSDETASLPSHLVLGGRLSYDAHLGALAAMITVTAENITNETYSTIRFYPMPPRHFGVGLNLEWRKPQ